MSERDETGHQTAILTARGALAAAASIAALAVCACASGCASIVGMEELHADENTGGGSGTPTGGGPTGGGSGASTGGGNAVGTQCVTPADCPGKDGDCQEVTCDSGVCGVSYMKNGGLAATQINGDCQLAACDGNGNVELVPDDLDAPEDGLECVETYCKDGSAVSEYTKKYALCGPDAKWLCDGQGLCVECLQDLDCGKGTECMPRYCEINSCVTKYMPPGTPCEGVKTCDGNGNCI